MIGHDVHHGSHGISGSSAACDCGYNITFVVEPVSSGTHLVSLYRRWDNLNTANDPVKITAAPVIVP